MSAPRDLVWSDAKRRLFRFETNLVVAAGAGSGKTTALVELYLRLLDADGPSGERPRAGRPLEPEEVVVVTFTEKAAQDLKRKVRERLLARLDAARLLADPVRARLTVARWERVRERLETAPVGTIHGYAARLLREHPVEAGVDPGFDVLDEVEAAALQEEAVDEVLREALAARDPRLARLLGHVRLGDAGEFAPGLASSLAAVLTRLRGYGTSVADLGRATAARLAEAEVARGRLAADLEAGAAALRGAPGAASFLGAWDALSGAARRLDAGLDDAGWERLLALKGQLEPWKGKGSQPAARKDLDRALKDLPLFAWQRVATPLAEAFLALLAGVDEAYAEAKRQRHALDFDDLEVEAVRLLRRDLAAGGTLLATRPTVVLVDEFQDNNRRQLELVTLLAEDGRGRLRERALVVVGDPKQSIYRFRGADVTVFHDVAALVGETLRFTECYRARPEVLTVVNGLFARYMGPAAVGRPAYEVPFDPEDRLLETRAAAGAPAVELLCLPPNEPAAMAGAREMEAVVRRICQLGAEGVPAGDVAVLMRTLARAPLLVRGLERAGVPVYVVKGGGFYDAPEVRDVLCLLASLESPVDDLALAALLRSPFVGVSDDALLLLARRGHEGRAEALAVALEAGRPPALPEADRERLAAFAAWHADLARRKDRTPLPDLIEEALERSGYLAVCLTRAGGDQQAGNLRKLVDHARAFGARPGRTLRDFVRRLERLVEEAPRETAAQVVGEGEDVVRVMTIHQAKGLEFPVVVLPGCADGRPGDRGPVCLDEDSATGGLALKPLDPDTLTPQAAWLGRRLAEGVEARARAEWRRLFYVAATRARDRLVLVGEHDVNQDGSPRAADTWRREVDALLAADPSLESRGALRRIAWADLPAAAAADERPADLGRPGDPAPLLRRLAWRPPPPRRFTHAATDLVEFETCPHRFYLRRRLGLPEAAIPWFEAADDPAEEGSAGAAVGSGDEAAPEPLPPVDRGTLAHRVLERAPLDLEGAALRAAVADLVDVQSLALPASVAAADRADLTARLVAFLEGPVGRALARTVGADAERVQREYPFVLRLTDGDGTLDVRGAIDLLWREDDGGWSLVDYKTTRRREPDPAAKYELQLLAYALAASRLHGAPVRRAGVAFLLDEPAEPCWIDVGPARLAALEARALGLAHALARLDQEAAGGDGWPRLGRPQCERLRCGFVARCHGPR